jgi:23S rRNA (pseudouridine1915-N3)-methyltransferase
MALLLLFVGKTKEGFLKEGIRKYETLVGHFLPLEIREIKGASSKERQAAIEEEADGILSRVLPADYLVVLDERGREFDSVSFSKELGKLMETGAGRIRAGGLRMSER